MKKSTIILIAIVAVALVAGIVFAVIRGASSGNQPGGTQTGTLPPVASGTPVTASSVLQTAPTGATFQIGTPQGSVTVNNIYKNNDYISQDGQAIAVAETGDYSIAYGTADSGFFITIMSVGGSLQAVRSAAEAAFLKALGVSQSDACKLSVDESVTDKTSQYYGDSLGLSFCPGSVPPSPGQ